ncbi:MAG TPA: hypothetical protein VFL83_07350 [Anaeromyxobacter sp.]|nr:hypothetical protein [Anaeromyxobacter sp.]
MVRPLRAPAALAAAVLLCSAAACARAPIPVREPTWSGRPPASGTPSYAETLEVLQFLLEEFPHGLPQRVSAPAPCVLRVVSSDDFTGYPGAAAGKVFQGTWVDLSRVAELRAKASGREPGAGAAPPTCASFAGSRGFALHTEIVAAAEGRPARHAELADERTPRVCIGHRATAERLATPLRHLVTLCGGKP